MGSAARMLGLKLLLLSVSLVVCAQGIAPDRGLDGLDFGGLRLLHLVLGMMGAGASLWFLPQFTVKLLGATVTCGVFCATVGTPFLSWAFAAYYKAPLPGPAENVLAFALGVVGVYLIPVALAGAAAFRQNPWGFVAWIRGGARGAPPPPPADGQGNGHV